MGYLMCFQLGTEAPRAVAAVVSEGQKGYFTSETSFAQAALASWSGGALK